MWVKQTALITQGEKIRRRACRNPVTTVMNGIFFPPAGAF